MSNVKIFAGDSNKGIYAEVIAHSVSPDGVEIATVAVKYGLYVHSEFLRHRALSRCVKSNRAIPTKVIRKEVLDDPYVPVFVGKNIAGMQSCMEVKHKRLAIAIWKAARYPAVAAHWLLEKMGAHKEWTNRLLNPWQWVRETITTTDWNNLYELRIHPAAQRDIRVVVECIKEAIDQSRSFGFMGQLKPGEHHTPYVTHHRTPDGVLHYIDSEGQELSVEQALVCSSARCARSSYDKHDGGVTTYANDKVLFDTLIADSPVHASPAEHQATPMQEPYSTCHNDGCAVESGVTHAMFDINGTRYSGNLRGWLQYRQTIPNNVKEG